MLKGDYFVKEADGWKEVHGGNKTIFDGTENIITYTQEPFARYIYMGIQNIIKKPSVSAETGKILCNYYKTVSATATYQGTEGISVDTSGNIIFRDAEKSSVEGFKQFLQEKYNAGNPIYVHYKTATSTKLPCTQAQSEVLEELSNLDLFDGVNNIITAENIALLKLKYALDVKTYVNNLIASQTTESEG